MHKLCVLIGSSGQRWVPASASAGDDGGVPRRPSGTRGAHQATVLQCREEAFGDPHGITPMASRMRPLCRSSRRNPSRIRGRRSAPSRAGEMFCRCPTGSAPLGEPHWASLSSEPYSPLGVSRGNGWSRSYLVKLTSVTLTVLASVRSMKNVFQRGLGAVAIGLGHHPPILDHDVVEARTFERLRHVDVDPRKATMWSLILAYSDRPTRLPCTEPPLAYQQSFPEGRIPRIYAARAEVKG